MAKIMVFIDGTWLYRSNSKLAESYGKTDYHLNFGALPKVLAKEVAKRLDSTDVDVVRTYLFGSYPENYDLRDDDAAQRQLDFYAMLKEEHHFETEIFPINFRGRRLRRSDRNSNDSFEPTEKCVDISLATSLLYFAAIPYAYDVAICVIGDQDFKPVLQHVRRLGKRVAIASIKDRCSRDLADPTDEARVKDFDVIWMDDLLHELELKFDRQQRECQSPNHRGDRRVWTTFRPRRGQKFFCEECKAEFARQKQESQREFVSTEPDPASENDPIPEYRVGQTLTGTIKARKLERRFGFIQALSADFYFHFTDLVPGLEFEQADDGLPVAFEVKRLPSGGKAGAAQSVRRLQALDTSDNGGAK